MGLLFRQRTACGPAAVYEAVGKGRNAPLFWRRHLIICSVVLGVCAASGLRRSFSVYRKSPRRGSHVVPLHGVGAIRQLLRLLTARDCRCGSIAHGGNRCRLARRRSPGRRIGVGGCLCRGVGGRLPWLGDGDSRFSGLVVSVVSFLWPGWPKRGPCAPGLNADDARNGADAPDACIWRVPPRGSSASGPHPGWFCTLSSSRGQVSVWRRPLSVGGYSPDPPPGANRYHCGGCGPRPISARPSGCSGLFVTAFWVDEDCSRSGRGEGAAGGAAAPR